MPNDYLSFKDVETETHHPIRLYTRYIDKVRPPSLPPSHSPSLPPSLHVSVLFKTDAENSIGPPPFLPLLPPSLSTFLSLCDP